MLFSLKDLLESDVTDLEGMLLANWFFESNRCANETTMKDRSMMVAAVYAKRNRANNLIGSIHTNSEGLITTCKINGKIYKAWSYQPSGLYYRYQIGDDKYSLDYGKYKPGLKRKYDMLVATPNIKLNGDDAGTYLVINDIVCFKFPPHTSLVYDSGNIKDYRYMGLPIYAYNEDANLRFDIGYRIRDKKITSCTITNKKTFFTSSIQFDNYLAGGKNRVVDIVEFVNKDKSIDGDQISTFVIDPHRTLYNNWQYKVMGVINDINTHSIHLVKENNITDIVATDSNLLDCIITHVGEEKYSIKYNIKWGKVK